MKKADIAMYHAKKLGKNNYQFFTKATENFNTLVRLIGGFVIDHKGLWNHSDWLKLLLDIQKKGIDLWCSSLKDGLGRLLESFKKIYALLDSPAQDHVITILCEEAAQLIQARKEVYRHTELIDTIKVMEASGVSLTKEQRSSLEDLLESVQSLYWLVAHKSYKEGN